MTEIQVIICWIFNENHGWNSSRGLLCNWLKFKVGHGDLRLILMAEYAAVNGALRSWIMENLMAESGTHVMA